MSAAICCGLADMDTTLGETGQASTREAPDRLAAWNDAGDVYSRILAGLTRHGIRVKKATWSMLGTKPLARRPAFISTRFSMAPSQSFP